MQSTLSLKRLLWKPTGFIFGLAFLAGVFASAPLPAFAEAGDVSIGPSGVSLSPTGNQHPGTPYTVGGYVKNSGSDDYFGTVFYMWYYSPNGGANWFDWSGLQLFTGLDGKATVDVSQSGTVGPPDGNAYSFRLCVTTNPDAGSGCSSAGSITPTAVPVTTYTLSVSKSGLGTVSGSGISCGSDCSETYTDGTAVSLSASPATGSGYAFDGWSGDCSGAGSCSLTMNSGKSVTANFIKVYNISASAGTGGTVSCPNCGSSVPSSTSVKATATANSGYQFSSWSGGSCSGSTANICEFTAGNSQSMTATFSRITYALSTSVSSGSGTISGDGTYNSGSLVAVTATPDDGYKFSGWGGACSGSGGCSVTMNGDKSVSASFSRLNYPLSISANNGSVKCNDTTCATSYPSGTTVNLSATPSDGYRFNEWSGNDCSGSSCSLTMNGSRSVTANFALKTLEVPPSPTSSFVKTGHRVQRAGLEGDCKTVLFGHPFYSNCDGIAPVVNSPSSGASYAPGETFRLTGNLSSAYQNFNIYTGQVTIAGVTKTFGEQINPGGSINFDLGPLSMPTTAGPHKINLLFFLSAGHSGWTETITGYVPVTVASPTRELIYPTAETGPCETPGTIKLSWTKADATKWSGYLLYRFPNYPFADSSGYQTATLSMSDPRLKSVADNKVEYIDTTPKQSTRYWYLIDTISRSDHGARSGSRTLAAVLLAQGPPTVSRGFPSGRPPIFVSSSGSDPTSAVSSDLCPSNNPSVLTPSAQTSSCGGKIKVTWTPWTFDSRVAGYVVYRLDNSFDAVSNASAYRIIKVSGATSGGYTDTVPLTNTKYLYAVMAATAAQMDSAYLGNVNIENANPANVIVGSSNTTAAPFQRVGFAGGPVFGEFGSVIRPWITDAVSSAPCPPPPPPPPPTDQTLSCPSGENIVASYTTPGSSTWSVPQGVGKVRARVWGAGGGGMFGNTASFRAGVSFGYGGGGGGYTETVISVASGQQYPVTVGAGGQGVDHLTQNFPAAAGGASNFGQYTAGGGGMNNQGGVGSTASGGAGGIADQTSSSGGGGGGGSGGAAGTAGLTAGVRGTGGAGGQGGGKGGDGGGGVRVTTLTDCRGVQDGAFPGGAGGGASNTIACGSMARGGNGANGAVLLCGVAQPNLTANAPALSDQWGNTGTVLGAGPVSIKGTVNNIGSTDAPGTFGNRYEYRAAGASFWNLLIDNVSLLDTSRSVGAGELNRAVAPHSWTGGVGAWEFRLFADSFGSVNESKETDNLSGATKVEIVDFTPTLTPNSPTAFVGDTVTFTTDAALFGALKDKTKVSYGNFTCDGSGTPVPQTLNAASFSCTYTTAGPKTATVSATYYKIPKSATAQVTATPAPLPDLIALSLMVEPKPNRPCRSTDPLDTGALCFYRGTKVTISGTIKNQGVAAITKTFSNSLRGAADALKPMTGGLTAGKEGTYTYTFPGIGVGTKKLQLCADSNGDIDESDEGNNCSRPPVIIRVLQRLAPKPALFISANPSDCLTNEAVRVQISPSIKIYLCWKVLERDIGPP